jgi:hypothetical protein
VLFVYVPAVFDVTSAETVQLAPAASFPPVRLIVADPGAAVRTLIDPQVPFVPFGLSTTRPAGSASVNAIPLSEPVEFGLVIVNDSAEVLPTVIDVGVNELVSVGGLAARAAAGAAAVAPTTTINPTNILDLDFNALPFCRSPAPHVAAECSKIHVCLLNYFSLTVDVDAPGSTAEANERADVACASGL